ncbi:MAG: hypothetical protein LC101_05325 [Flavobacteriales bacterium]|nr:hypothetical protein [Flavobacteriales bacterium]MCZ2443178.1 hypothetical protein [Flavobacteriales bacterium]
MNQKVILSILLPIFGICVYLFISQQQLAKQITNNAGKEHHSEKKEHDDDDDDDEGIDLLAYMNRLQLYMNKLWYAGENNNWELSEFYIEEIEEAMEDIAKNPLIKEGVRVDQLMKNRGLPSIKELEDVTEKKDIQGFKLSYNNMVSSCNKCHEEALHPFIKIKIPESPIFTNQIY